MNRDIRLIMWALLLWGVGEGLFYHIQTLYIEQLGAHPVQIGGLLSAMSVASAITLIPAGMLSDRLPRKQVMIGGWIVGLGGVLLIGMARTWQGLIPGLLIYSFSSYCVPVINAYLAHAVSGRDLERTLTTVFAGFALGGIISPMIGGWLAAVWTMRAVYFVSAGIFFLSTLVVSFVSPQPVTRSGQGRLRLGWQEHWRGHCWPIREWRFLAFIGLVGLIFGAMYVGFPLAPNFLADVRGWDVTCIGMLGSLQALGTTTLNLWLGRLGNGGRLQGLLVGQALVWCSACLLVISGAFPALAAAYLLRGAYQGCRSLAQARAVGFGREEERGLVLGITETMIAIAQMTAPYIAGWLYAGNPAWPLWVSLGLIPLAAGMYVGVMPRLMAGNRRWEGT